MRIRPASVRPGRRSFTLALLLALLLAGLAHAAPVSWNVDASGLWTAPGNWTSGPLLPGPGDDVTIDRPAGDYTITLDSGAQSINSLLTSEALQLTGGTLSIATTAQFNRDLTLTAGTLQGGTWTAGNGAKVQLSAPAQMNLDGVTLNADVNATAPAVVVSNGLTLNGTWTIATPAGALRFAGTQTLGGTGQVQLGTAGATLTIGSGITVSNVGVYPGQNAVIGDPACDLVNQGTLSAIGGGGTLTIRARSLTNLGTLKVVRLGTLDYGRMVVDATVEVGGLDNFDATGGLMSSFALAGTLRNAGHVLALTGPGQQLTLEGGTIDGGTITATGGAKLWFGGNYGVTNTLSAVTLATSVMVDRDKNTLRLTNGLTLQNATITLDANAAGLLVSGTQTIDGTGEIVFNGTVYDGGLTVDGGQLTIGPQVALRSGTTNAPGAYASIIGSTDRQFGVINQGAIIVPTSLKITAGQFTNQGLVQTTGAGTLTIDLGTVHNPGTIELDGGSVTLRGQWESSGTIRVNAGGSLSLEGTFPPPCSARCSATAARSISGARRTTPGTPSRSTRIPGR